MSVKPDDISAKVWDAAYDTLHPVMKAQYETSPFSRVMHLGIARAIMSSSTEGRSRIGSDEWISSVDEYLLIGTVMKLTGGSANPVNVKAQIENARKRQSELG